MPARPWFDWHRQGQGYSEEGFASHLHNQLHSSPLPLAMLVNTDASQAESIHGHILL